MTTEIIAEHELRDLIDRLDQALRTASLIYHGDENVLEPALEDAAAFLRGLQLQNGGDAMSDSPTFVCEFSDGEVTRMTVATSLKNLDVERGVRLARHAYRQRKRAASITRPATARAPGISCVACPRPSSSR